MTYIATCYSHFGAIRCKRICDDHGLPARLMPVPRSLSSSCGTCVCWEGGGSCPEELRIDEVEQIVRAVPGGFEVLYRAENS